MKYVTPFAEIISASKQDILTFSVQKEGDARSDVLDFNDLVRR
jgi:hypothetical protein